MKRELCGCALMLREKRERECEGEGCEKKGREGMCVCEREGVCVSERMRERYFQFLSQSLGVNGDDFDIFSERAVNHRRECRSGPV